MPHDDLAAAVLDLPSIVEGRSFVELGGDSLRAMRLVALVQEQTGVRLRTADLLGGAPLSEVLAAAGPARDGGPAPGPGPAGGLSPAQRGMWMVERLTGGPPYNLVFTCLVERGRVAEPVLRAALAGAVARHAGLRTVHPDGPDGTGIAEVLAAAGPRLTVVELDAGPAEFAAAVAALADAAGREPFDLAVEPGLRFLWVTGAGQALVLLAHHMVLDGWAVGLLLREIVSRCAGAEPGPAPGPEALRRREADRAAVGDGQLDFWREQLAGVPADPVPRSAGRPAPSRDHGGMGRGRGQVPARACAAEARPDSCGSTSPVAAGSTGLHVFPAPSPSSGIEGSTCTA